MQNFCKRDVEVGEVPSTENKTNILQQYMYFKAYCVSTKLLLAKIPDHWLKMGLKLSKHIISILITHLGPNPAKIKTNRLGSLKQPWELFKCVTSNVYAQAFVKSNCF